jgi:hypothetical protein
MGAAAFSVAQSALTDAPATTDKVDGCELARLGAEMLTVAVSSMEAGQEVAPEAARQYLDYLGKLRPYADRQLEVFCVSGQPGLKDRYGVSWQVVPTMMDELFKNEKSEGAQRAMEAMLRMKKIDIAELRRAYDGAV